MKNWKFIKVGNGIEISGVAGKLPPDSEISKTIYEELKKNNYDKDKTVLSLSIKYKAMPNARMFFEDAVEKVIKSYKNRTVNESINKQEWSMFKGLTKKAEEEVGNFKTGKSKLSVGDKVSLYGVKGTVKGITGENSDNIYGEPVIEFESEDGKTKQVPEHYLVKVGNKAIVLKDGNVWVVLYANETKSQEFESEAEAREFAKKVGNSYTPNPELIKILEAWLHNRMSEQEARSKIMKITGDKNITDMMIHSPGGFIPAGNSKTGNADTVSEYNAEIQRLTKKAEQLRRMGQGRSAMEIEKQIEKLGRELRELGNKKTGNAGRWNATKTMYGKWDDTTGRPAEEYARITWLGEGKGGLVNIWKGHQMTSEKYGSNDLEDLRRWAEQRIGNETLAEYAKSKPRIINGTWEEPRKMPFQEKSLRYAYEKAKSKGLSGKKLEDEMLRIVSTTPHESSANEQEKRNDVNKWILRNGVSSDFVNNLKRARNAMAKNQKTTLWKGNDTVYISEDGTVQYLENNAFETDRDKFESQEKAIEELTKQGYRKK